MLKNDIMQPSDSPFNSEVWAVSKRPGPNNEKRCSMYITDILDQLGEAGYFSTLDLASGFHEIGMHPTDAHKTAFSTQFGHYELKRMSFGTKNGATRFQQMMGKVLSGFQGVEMFIHMNDIVIYARNLKEHEIM